MTPNTPNRIFAARFVAGLKLGCLIMTITAVAACGGGGDTAAGGNVGTTYSVGGSLSGLGQGKSVVLQNNGTDTLTVSANGSYSISLASGTTYSIAVLTQPSGQLCEVTNGTGTVTGNISDIAVTCADLHSVGGTLSGLTSGKTIALQDNGGDNVTLVANGPFTFPTLVPSGSGYGVTVLTQPTAESCSVANGSGTVSNADVTNVAVTCASNLYNVAAVVTGLISGRTLVLRNNGGDNLTFTKIGTKNFNTALASGAPYSVTVFTQPPGENCVVTNGSGTMPASNKSVAVSCTPIKYSIGGSVSGLASGASVVLQNNGGNSTTVSAASFTFSTAIASGSAYAVTVLTQPTGQSCTVTNGTGTVGSSNVTNVSITCSNTVAGTNVGMGWDAVSDTYLKGYRVYYGKSSGVYLQALGSGLDAGNATTYVVPNLAAGTYYFAVTAYDSWNTESGYSTEISKTVP